MVRLKNGKGFIMLDIVKINLQYEEMALKFDSLPGWKLLESFAKTISEMPLPFNGWIFEWNRKKRCYADIRKFDSENKAAFIGSLFEFITKDAVCFIKTLEKASLEILSQNYTKVSEGTIKDNQESAVFSAPIEMGDWAIIGENELVIVIHHDGDPLIFLKKEKEKGGQAIF